MWGGLFSDPQASRDFLGVIAASIITVTSITLSLLLIAVQQGAASLTSLVFDQFLRRRTNQLYFGVFIGLALYALIVLASINASHQPIYGLAVAGVMTAAALYMLILLIYTTINQMRPVVIIKAIHDHTLLARARQRDLLRSTRRSPRLEGGCRIRVATDRSGFVVRMDTAAITKVVTDTEIEVTFLVSIGDYVAFGDAIAAIRIDREHDVSSLEAAISNAVVLEEQRGRAVRRRPLAVQRIFRGLDEFCNRQWLIYQSKMCGGRRLDALMDTTKVIQPDVETDCGTMVRIGL
jgi:uncharacterized membrane protein